MKFTYSSGQRPLDGYTIKRGIGRGGFGEVYYGLSDGGKEVALKLIRGDLDIELRGMSQCLNFKHPNLVNLYDMRTDAHGDHWVIMEYVAGETLSSVLARHPKGLPRELVREWFLALGRAVAHLHDQGIVHRDLKPGNIFLENGILKVGDYGLSKSIGASQRTAQTQSVGTVHYMAPEISTGNYNKQIDIYAAGIILYEMLTGRVPFEGESTGEILMKHLTAAPDLSKLPAEYAPIVARALAKNPAHRHGSMAEMARAVEAIAGEPLRAAPQPKPAPPVARAVPVDPVRNDSREQPVLTALPAVSARGLISELSGSMILSVIFTALVVATWATLGQVREMAQMGSLFFLTVASCWAVLIPSKVWTERRGDSWSRRVVMLFLGMVLGVLALWIEGWGMPLTRLAAPPAPGGGEPSQLMVLLPSSMVTETSFVAYYGLALFALRWWRSTDRRRSQRFSLVPILAAAFWAVVLGVLLRPGDLRLGLSLVFASGIVQLVSPWQKAPPPQARRLRLRYA